MSFPTSGSAGYQITDGNVNSVEMVIQTTEQTATSTATLTAAQLTGGILVANPSTSAATYTLPTVAVFETTYPNFKVDSGFILCIVNLGTASGALTIAAGTGWTITGSATVAVTSSAQYQARKTGSGTWTLYRIA